MRYTGRVLESSSSPETAGAGGAAFSRPNEYIAAIAGVAALTVGCWLLTPLTGYGAISLIYLLGVLLAGVFLSRGPVLLVAALSSLAWNFLFIPPRFTLHIAKLEDTLTFATYFIIAIIVGGLTAQLKAREHLAAQVQLAQESERLRKTLLDCISHELKTPLAAIAAASQALAHVSSADVRAQEELVREIRDGSHRLHRVVNNLLDMSRLESGVIRPNREWCDVRELLQSAAESERESIDGRDVRFTLAENLPLALLDHSLIEQAVAKLIANAGTHTPSALPVEIEADYDDGELRIAVSDRGPGLPPDAAERVFEKFYRGDQRKAGGLGLGLSIARGFVEAHGGRLLAHRRDGGGTRFAITLPVQVTDAQAIEHVL